MQAFPICTIEILSLECALWDCKGGENRADCAFICRVFISFGFSVVVVFGRDSVDLFFFFFLPTSSS